MEAFAVGDIVLVSFPFTDLSDRKTRPAFVASLVGGHDLLLCMITSHAYNDPHAIPVPEADFHSGGLLINCAVRPRHLFTGSTSINRKKTGSFTPDFTRRIKDTLVHWLAP